MERMAPNCIDTWNIFKYSLSSIPMRAAVKPIWAVDEIGKYLVNPSTIARIMASK